MNKMKELLENYQQKWWLFLVIGILIGFALAAIPQEPSTTRDELQQCQQQLSECKQSLSDTVSAWNDYVWAMKDYCDLDALNPVCIAQREMIDSWTANHPRH